VETYPGMDVIICYDLKLGSGCNLGKDLSKSKGDDQLVKCKDARLYLYLVTMRKEKGVLEETIRKE